jgi:regulatory protein
MDPAGLDELAPSGRRDRANHDDPSVRLQHAYEIAFRFLGHRDRTVAEVAAFLEKKGVRPAVTEEVLADLQRQGYLDDAGYAARLAEDKRELEGWGAERIERRLLAAGVDRDLVRETLGERTRDDELEAALGLLRRRFPGSLEDPREAQRAFGVLARKGFEPELAGDAIRAHRRGED